MPIQYVDSYGPTYVCTPVCMHAYTYTHLVWVQISPSVHLYVSMPPSIRPSLRPRARMYGWIEEWTEAKYTAACTQINATLTEWDGYRVKFKVLSIFPMYLSNASLLAATVTRPETLKSCLAHVHLAPWCCPPAHTGTWKISTVFPNWNSWHPFYGNYWKLVEGDSCRFYPGPSVEWKLTITTRITASVCWSARTQRKPVVLEELLVPCPAWPSWNLDSSST